MGEQIVGKQAKSVPHSDAKGSVRHAVAGMYGQRSEVSGAVLGCIRYEECAAVEGGALVQLRWYAWLHSGTGGH